MAAPEAYNVPERIFEGAVVSHASAYSAFLLNDLPTVFLCLVKVAVDVVNLEDSGRAAMLHALHERESSAWFASGRPKRVFHLRDNLDLESEY